MHVPGNLLASLPESENSSNQFSRKLNLRLDVQNGGIDVDIHLLGDAARAGEGGRKERAFLHLEVKDGYEQGLDKFPLVTRIVGTIRRVDTGKITHIYLISTRPT